MIKSTYIISIIALIIVIYNCTIIDWENPFSGVFDIRLTKEIKTYKKQRLTLSVDVFNFANLLNKEWGRNFNFSTFATQTLLFLTGFDQVKKEYIYRVNENVGVQQANGTPYQIQIGARYAF